MLKNSEPAARPRQRPRDDRDEPLVVPAGLEEEARAARAAGLDVLDDGDAARRRGIGDEAFRADQPLLLGVGDEEDDGIPRPLAAHGARDLEERGDARAVIARP